MHEQGVFASEKRRVSVEFGVGFVFVDGARVERVKPNRSRAQGLTGNKRRQWINSKEGNLCARAGCVCV